MTVCDAGEAAIEKSGAAETTRLVVAEWVKLPLVPVMVMVEVPAGVLPAVVTVSVDAPLPVTLAGEKLAVAPAGNPVAAKFTTPAKPFRAPMVTA